MHRRDVLAAATAATAMVAAPWVRRPAAAEPVTLTVHHFLPASSTTQRFIEDWGARLKERTGGALEILIYPSMGLGGRPPQLFDQARDGIADVVWTLPGYTAGRFPKTETFELPFVAPQSAKAVSRAVQAFGERHLVDEFRGVKVLMWHAHAPGTFHLRGRPVRNLEDLAGAKIRAPSRVVNETLAALGASPIGMPVPSVPQALAQGVIDGALLPYEVTRSLRIHELTDSNTEIGGPRGLYTAVFLFAMNDARYRSLPPDLQDAVDAESGAGLAERTGILWDEAEASGRQAALDAGHAVTVIEGEALERWRERARPVTSAWLRRMAEAGFDAETLLADAEALAAAG